MRLPHLIVGGLISLVLWVVIPSVQAYLLNLHAWGPIGVHAFAGMFLALVICWRQAILLLAGLPILLIGSQISFVLDQNSIANQFIAGNYPLASALAIVIAVLAQPLAAWFLLHLSDQDVSVSDDFAVEIPRNDRALGRFDELLLVFRDAVVRHRLADVGHGWWAIQRWRIPVVISWVQMLMAVIIGTLLAGLSWWGAGHPRGAVAGIVVATVGMLIAPFNGWHMRRGALGFEIMRPITRFQFFAEIAAAVALDVAAWAALASAFACLGCYLIAHSDPGLFGYLFSLLALLWSAAVLFYGVGLATFRIRYWLPVMVGMVMGWAIVASIVVNALAAANHNPQVNATVRVVVATSLSWLLGGLMITAATLVRWNRSDVG